MNERAEPKTVGLRLLNLDKKFVEPYTIQDKFVSLVAFHQAEREVLMKDGSLKKFTERVPLFITWDGTEIKYGMAEMGNEYEINGEHYILDRPIDETPNLPSDELVMELTKKDSKLIENFNPKDYFDAIYQYFEYYFYLGEPTTYKIISLYVANMMAFDANPATPYLYIRAPARGCGKSYLGQTIINMCNGLMTTNIKVHHIFRLVHGTKTVMGFDEIKNWTGKGSQDADVVDKLSLVNAGFQREGCKVPRLEEKKGGRMGEMKVVLYESYSPKIFITTSGGLPDDTMSRCIEIMMHKAGEGPTDIKYGKRSGEGERFKKLRKIRDMGYIFRLKYGSELKGMSEEPDGQLKLDIKDTFSGIENRELQIYRPLMIMCLKFIPEWQDDLAKHIKGVLENKSKLEYSPLVVTLMAIREIWQTLEKGGFVENANIVKHEKEGAVLHVPVNAILSQIRAISDHVYLGREGQENSTIGRVLNDLGFTTAKRQKYGIQRLIQGIRFSDMCVRYLGSPIGNAEPGGGLCQQEKMNLIREALLDPATPKGGLMLEQLLYKLNGRVTDGELRAYLKEARTNGWVTMTGGGKIDGEGFIRWYDP